MSDAIHTKVLVIGGGPGGYVAAIRAGQLGLDTTLVESDTLGGTCLIRGCIPSKAMIHVAGEFETMAKAASIGLNGIRLAAAPVLDMAETVRWKEGITGKLNAGVTALLKRAKVRVVHGWAQFSDAKTCTVAGDKPVTIAAEHVILANGSLPVALPHLPFGGPVISSTEALSLDALPKKLVVVGGGYIGLELGIAFRKMGAEVDRGRSARPHPAALRRRAGRAGAQMAGEARRVAASGRQGEVAGRAARRGAADRDNRRPARWTCRPTRSSSRSGASRNTEGWGLENMGLDMAGRFIKVDDQCRTAMKNVWAIGDLVGEPMLAHKASAQGEMVAEIIAGHRRRFDPVAIAAVCFTEPESSAPAAAGRCGAKGPDVITALFPLSAERPRPQHGCRREASCACWRAPTIIAFWESRRSAPHVSELSAEFALALEMGATLEDVAGTIHVHPTLGEAFHESALRALGHAIHI